MQLGLVNRTVLVIYSYGTDAAILVIRSSIEQRVGTATYYIFECSIHPQVYVYSYCHRIIN